jgi:ABC-type branched-subunit amino acid transport system permease subunit
MSTTSRESLASVQRYSASSLGGLGVAGVILIVLALLPSLVGESIVNRLTQLFSLLILAVGWNLLAGYGGMVSIGQQAFLGLSSYMRSSISRCTACSRGGALLWRFCHRGSRQCAHLIPGLSTPW